MTQAGLWDTGDHPVHHYATGRRIEDVAAPAFLSARATDPATSHEAAAAQTGRTERLILEMFERCFADGPAGGWTDDDIAHIFDDLHGPTVKSARSRLTKAGLLVDSGERRPSDRGRDQIVWKLP